MLNQDNLKKIKEITEEFFKKMTFEVKIDPVRSKTPEASIGHVSASRTSNGVDFLPQPGQVLSINLESEEPQILIGERGETLLEIQHLLKIILKRKAGIEEVFYVDLDINDYKKKKAIYLREMARSLAEEAVLTKKEKILPPMPSYERRIIHLELADNPNVTTDSIGQEPERQVVIRPYP